jgi:hypothetical protein
MAGRAPCAGAVAMEIACEIRTKSLTDADLAFLCRAVNFQMENHMAPAYAEEPWPVRSYATLAGLSAGSFWPLAIIDDVGKDGALGFHDWIAGLSFGRVTTPKDPHDGSCLSHEVGELRGDPNCNIWIPMPDGRSVAYERNDPCEQDQYGITVTIGDETRSILVSDFVLPAWFVPGAPRPYTYLDTVDAPFGLSRNGGGYRLIRDKDGTISSDFDGRYAVMHDRLSKKVADPLSRTYRRGLR